MLYWIGRVHRRHDRRDPGLPSLLPALGETEDKGLKLAVFCTAPAIRNPLWNLVSEIIGTFVLVFVVFCLGTTRAHRRPSVAPWPGAFLVLVIGLRLGGTTGYAINPARDLGPRIMHASCRSRARAAPTGSTRWIPVVGPLVGGAVAAVVY